MTNRQIIENIARNDGNRYKWIKVQSLLMDEGCDELLSDKLISHFKKNIGNKGAEEALNIYDKIAEGCDKNMLIPILLVMGIHLD